MAIATDVIQILDSEEKNTAQKLVTNQSKTSGKFPFNY